MANFTDTPVNFTGYIQESPVEALYQVGITKQQQYAEGLQKVQTYVDTLGGLDLSKQEIKDYVQQKMSSLHRNLNNISGDFSDNRLVSQIGGAASKIANDPIVQNGIIATSAIKNGYSKMEAARKEGKSNPNNELFFTDKVAGWQNDGQLNTKFEGEYTPYFDIVGEVRKVFKDMVPGQELPPGFGSRNIKTDQNGNVVFDLNYAGNMVNMEGISVERVQNAIDLVMQNGNAKQQLNIDGYANYRGVEPPQMFEAIKGSTQKQLKVWNDAIAAAQSKLGGSTAGDKAQLLADINHMKSLSEQLVAQSDSYIQGLGTNPDGVKAQLTEQQLRTDLVGAFAYQKMVESPLWNANKELEQLQLTKDKFTFDQFDANRKFQLDQEKLDLEKTKVGIELDKAKKEKGDGNFVADLPVPSIEGTAGSASMYKVKEDNRAKAEEASFQALSEYARSIPGQVEPFKFDPATNKWIPNADAFGGGKAGTEKAYEERIRIMQDMKSRRSKGTLTPEAAIAMQKEEAAWDEYNLVDNKILEIEKSVKPQIDAIKNSVGTSLTGAKYNPDWFDAYQAEEGLPGSDGARARLEKKYGEDWRYTLGIKTITKTSMGDVPRESGDWTEFKKKVKKNPNTVELAQQIENKFKGSQFAYQNKATVFDRGKPEQQQDVKTAFTAALTEQSLASPQGDAGDMKEWMSDKPEKQAGDQYMAWSEYKQGKQTWWLGIQRGDKFKKVEVKQQAFQQNRKLQEAIPNVEFQNMFSTRLALRGGQDTYTDDNDVLKNSGQVSAYNIYMNSGTIKYTDNGQQVEGSPVVQYHLEQPATAQGQYRIKLYITDGKTGKVLVQGAPYPPSDQMTPGQTPALSQEQVVDQVKFRLSNPAFIQGYLDKYYNKK